MDVLWEPRIGPDFRRLYMQGSASGEIVMRFWSGVLLEESKVLRRLVRQQYYKTEGGREII